VSRPLQARAKRNAIVHAATSAPRSLIVNRSLHRPILSSARVSPVVRPNARVHRTRHRVAIVSRGTCIECDAVPMTRALGRRRFVADARVPPSRSRAAAGRCAVRRHHRSHRLERHAPPPQSVRRPHAGRSASRPGNDANGALIVDRRTALQLTPRRAPASRARSFMAWRCATERGQGENRRPPRRRRTSLRRRRRAANSAARTDRQGPCLRT